MNWTAEKTSDVCTTFRIGYEEREGWEQWVLLGADCHLDNPSTDLELKKFHYGQAKERNAIIQEHGDWFDLMQGKFDRRSAKESLRPELTRTDYLNAAVEYSYEFLKDYKENLGIMSQGNHETAMTKIHEYDPLHALIYLLKQSGSPVIKGGYRGWIRYMFERSDGNGGRFSKRAYFHHGFGGGVVTKGILEAARRGVTMPEADYVFTGHIHERWHWAIERIKLLDSGREVHDKQHHIQISTYKEEFANKSGGFHHETAKPPKPLGGWWMRFYWSNRTKRVETQFIETED